MNRVLSIVGWILTILGLLMMVAGGIGFLNERAFVGKAVMAQAVVVEMIEKRGDNGPTFAPVYVFQDNAGQKQKIYSRCSSYPPAHQVGDKVAVLYDPQAPRDAQMQGFFDMWGWMTIVGGIGLLYAVIGPILLVFARKRKQKTANHTPDGIRQPASGSPKPSV